MTDRVCVVMPTYNERDNLEPTLTGVFVQNPGVDVLIVDDASPDGTWTTPRPTAPARSPT